MSNEEIYIGAALILLALFLIVRGGSSGWKFTPMLMTHRGGEQVPDRQAFVLLGSFFVSTAWGTVMVLRDQMSEWYFMCYMLAWAGSHYGSRYLKSKSIVQK